MSIRQFCDSAKNQLEKCNDFESKRKFLTDHIEKVVYQNYKATIIGSVPIRSSAYEEIDLPNDESKIPFRIEGEIDTSLLHRGPRQKFAEDGRLKKYGSGKCGIEKIPCKHIRLL
ncbi:MAG: hypothetical protein COU90_01190 [Candidatus Ryanbacteria bacterium CG10_big_fil_rev_8_21_14_0_10_43_42]|uniref:Uncharacterized protein n=1 Tax=Candidatus Ryanbacteria bacterium CG10_big_fil_rev_8_21_14_0_10_43_42 TaxID=1974864 RepID=A0A2M8KY97_9BACT|nr:MAG: hypothetical protein COU90_01190 [Candidatus Ryanbacteria bacterium CG10_big_fil_rev_8_21_14_0_10_43_42]